MRAVCFHVWVVRNRFTNLGDAVMTCSGERDGVAEIALSLGRKVEVFVANSDTHSDVSRRVEAAFETPYREGYVQVILRGANRIYCRRSLTLLSYCRIQITY